MLARLLRRILLTQVFVGALVGGGLVWAELGPWWLVAVLALAWPVVTTLFLGVLSAVLSRPGEGAAFWWRAMVGELWASVRIFLIRQHWTWGQPESQLAPNAGTAEAKVPVVLVHGYLCNHRIWDDMGRALRAQGHSTLAVNLEPVFASIDDYTTIIEAAMDELCRVTGAKQVALVGHSMGGLAIRATLRAHGTARVARVLTLGTPHAGTRVMFNDFTPNGRQMQWQSPWIQQLNLDEPEATRALFRVGLTPQDNIVYPQRAQVLPGVEPQVFHGIGHLQMCLDAGVIRWVVQNLGDIPLVRA